MASTTMAFSVLIAGLAALIQDSSAQNCSAYQDMESQKHCGPSGYFIAYAYKYCTRFYMTAIYARFDANGKTWIGCVRDCLITRLQAYVQATTNATCTDIQTFAFKTHEPCYLKCGFCAMCKTNKNALLHVYDAGDVFSKQGLAQAFRIARKCPGFIPCFF